MRLVEGTFLCDLLTDAEGAVCGALLATDGVLRVLRAGAVVLASGGYGQLFAETTSQVTCTGDGAAAALRAGAQLADVEFVQFHPTTLHVPADPRPLISEAMRGEGAVLRDQRGASVTEGVHPLGDLAPRDVVSRAMVTRMQELGVDHLFLDATGFGSDRITHRFPTIVAACRAFGIDPAFESIPVSPAAHYTMGGVRTDLSGRASLAGLYAVGEVAESGVHGANRLASNSLLEGVVFGRRCGRREIVADHRRAGSASGRIAAALVARAATAPTSRLAAGCGGRWSITPGWCARVTASSSCAVASPSGSPPRAAAHDAARLGDGEPVPARRRGRDRRRSGERSRAAGSTSASELSDRACQLAATPGGRAGAQWGP